MSYRVIRIKIPNVFLRNIEVNDTYLDKDKIENYLKYESLSPEFKKQFEVYSQMKESQKDSESQEDSESDSSSDTNNQDNALSSEFINNKPELKLPDLSHLYLEDRLAYETSNHYGYKTFLQVQKRITGHRITKLIQYSELIGYLSNTLLFPFIEIEHKEGGSFDMICKYNYEILKGHSSGENYYHRSGLMKDTVSLVNISWESLKNRLMGNSTSIKNQIFLNYDSLAKELLPIDLQYLMKNQKGAGGQALEIRNN